MQLTARERAIMIVLMAEARELSTAELQTNFGLAFDRASRQKLNYLQLVGSRREGRHFVHTLTDLGWQSCRAEFEPEGPPLTGLTGGAMAALLRGVGRFMERSGYSPADLFDPSVHPPKAM